MFVVNCHVCHRRYLVGAGSVRRLSNLRPGMIVVELSCPHGHPALEVTGAAGREAAADVLVEMLLEGLRGDRTSESAAAATCDAAS